MMSKPFQVWQDVYAMGGPDITGYLRELQRINK